MPDSSGIDLNSPPVLIVDDDNRLRRLLRKFLTENGFRVFSAADSRQADELRKWFVFDLMVVDVMMPGESGIDYVRRLRAANDSVPVLMLTAMGETENRIDGLEAGADDYLPKPFDPRELLLRIRSVLRRTDSKPPERQKTEVAIGPFRYDLDACALYRESEKLRLPPAEETLIRLLAKRAGQTVSREELAQSAGCEASLRTVDVQITRLRRRLEDDPAKPRYIQTVRGIGYSLIPD